MISSNVCGVSRPVAIHLGSIVKQLAQRLVFCSVGSRFRFSFLLVYGFWCGMKRCSSGRRHRKKQPALWKDTGGLWHLLLHPSAFLPVMYSWKMHTETTGLCMVEEAAGQGSSSEQVGEYRELWARYFQLLCLLFHISEIFLRSWKHSLVIVTEVR